MFLRWLKDSTSTVIGMSASRQLRFAGMLPGLTAMALSCASASAQDDYYLPADFQKQRANPTSFIPMSFTVESAPPAAAPPAPGT